MKNIITIFNREVKAYFNASIAYIFIIVFLLLAAGLFMGQFFIVGSADMRGFFYSLPIILCVFIPAVTMRLWAEEKRGNTLELLLTFPVKTYELVLGKFFASLFFYTVSLLATLSIPIMISILGKPDTGVIFSQYLGSVILGSFFLALGIFISGFCKDQIVSFILSMMACFTFFLLGVDFTVGSVDGWIPGLGTFLKNSLGMIQHFDDFQRGVIDIRSFLYFALGTAAFLTLNGFWLDIKLRPKAKSVFTVACLISAGIFLLVNFIFADIPVGRFDLTQEKIYTISPATKEILQDLKAPVTAKLFISPQDKMPSGLKTIERDIKDKLEEFKASSKGKFDYKVFHLEAAQVDKKEEKETLEQSIEKKGIKPFQVRSIEADEIGVKLIYSGLSLAYKEKPEQIIPQITPESLKDLEYAVVSKIYKMTLDKQPEVALLAPYKEKISDPGMQEVLKNMGPEAEEKIKDDAYSLVPRLLQYEGYKVTRIKLNEKSLIPDGANTLLIIGPENLNDRQRFEINKFLVNGGSVFLAAQKYDFDYKPVGVNGLQVGIEDKNPNVNPLLAKWGISVSDDFLMDTQIDVVSLSGGRLFGIFEVSAPVKLPMQIKVIEEQMDKDISITTHLPTMFYLWGSALKLDAEKLKQLGLTSDVLFTSSPQAWETKAHEGDLTNDDMAQPAPDKLKQFILGALIRGQFPDAFKDQAVPDWPKEDTTEAAGKESYEKPKDTTALIPKPGKLIITGCARMFTKELLDKGGHMNFLLNSVDSITFGEKLIRVRSKQPTDRSLKIFSSATKAWWRIFITFFMPAIICLIGGLRIFFRKRSKWAYLKTA